MQPMIETMRMHPNLIVSNHDIETSAQRYMIMFMNGYSFVRVLCVYYLLLFSLI